MSRIAPLPRSELSEFEPLFEMAESVMGFVPNSMLTMGRRPELLRAFAGLVAVALGPGEVPAETKQLVAHVASLAAGCRYCQAHTASSAHRAGAAAEKIGHAFEFETHPEFTQAERAALRLARDAALQPSEVSDAHFDALREHWSEAQIVEIVGVIATFGYLNRWNDTMATPLEREPLDFARAHLAASGWTPGAHER